MKPFANRDLYVALVHWPVLDKAGRIVCTNITNFDIHDIARVGRSMGVKEYFLVNKIREQLMFVERILDHWRTGYGNKLNPKRVKALEIVRTAETVEAVIDTIVAKGASGRRPIVVATAARDIGEKNISFKALKEKLFSTEDSNQPILLLFGTGFGLDEKVIGLCDYLLEPIRGASKDDYRHLSVRSAVSICLDRLMSVW